jgi:Flp pilus assembly protein TadD
MAASSATRSRAPTRTAWRVELVKGARLLRRGDGEGARACFARAHALKPDQPEPALALGREEWKRGRLVEAEALLRLAWRARPGWPLAAAALARVLTERGITNEARAILAQGFKAGRATAALWLVLGELELADDHPERAATAFEQARSVGARPHTVQAGLARVENLRGIALTDAKRQTEAAFAFKRAADLDPTWAPPHVNLGALLQQLSRTRGARDRYRHALELDPRNGIAHFNLGLLSLGDRDLAGAQRSFAAALAADPPHPRARQELALVHAERGDYGCATKLLEEELRVTRRADASVYANLGLAYAKSGDRHSAEAALRQALALEHRHAHALANLAALCAADGRYLEAAALLRRAPEDGNSSSSPASK